ncbi:MAG: hypothetical protein Alpg2KO_14980 [Alphaproteobacteria bacterium]
MTIYRLLASIALAVLVSTPVLIFWTVAPVWLLAAIVVTIALLLFAVSGQESAAVLCQIGQNMPAVIRHIALACSLGLAGFSAFIAVQAFERLHQQMDWHTLAGFACLMSLIAMLIQMPGAFANKHHSKLIQAEQTDGIDLSQPENDWDLALFVLCTLPASSIAAFHLRLASKAPDIPTHAIVEFCIGMAVLFYACSASRLANAAWPYNTD